MTVDQSAAEADVKVRTPGRLWIWYLVWGGLNLVFAADNVIEGRHVLASLWLALGFTNVGMAWARRSFGVDLTPESAIVRGFRRHRVPWKDVQSVVRHEKSKSAVVCLILEKGEPVTLRFPTTIGRKADTQYERDFRRIDQWWLAHRGEAWRQLHPEEPRL